MIRYSKVRFLFFVLIATIMFCNIFAIKTTLVFAEESQNQGELKEITINLDNLSQYNYVDNFSSKFLFVSSNDNLISLVDESVKSLSDYGTEDGKIISPSFAKTINENEVLVIDGLNRIQIFDNEFNYIKRYLYIENHPIPLSLGTIVSVDCDYLGNLYMLDKTNNMILKLNTDYNNIQQITVDFQFTICDDSRLSVNANGDKIALINVGDFPVVIDISSNTYNLYPQNSYDGVMFDCMDNLYFLEQSTQTIITKYECGNYTTAQTQAIETTYTSFDFDIETGNLYLLNDKLYCYSNTSFFSNANTEISPIDITTSTNAHTQSLDVCETKNNTKLYSTCVSFSSNIVLQDGTKVIILQKSIPQNKNMSYVLTSYCGAEIKGYVEIKDLTEIVNTFETTNYKTICKNVEILSYPSQNSGIVSTILDENSQIVVVGNTCDYCDFNNESYYEISIDNKIAYVNQKYLINCNLQDITSIDPQTVDTNQSQFIAFILILFCLFVTTLFICYLIHKKSKQTNS